MSASSALSHEVLVWPALATVALLLVFIEATKGVGAMRHKLKIAPPAMTGHPDLERAVRAQANTIEFLVAALPLLWLSAVFFSGPGSALVGVVAACARYSYVLGYVNTSDGKGRVKGFYIGVYCLYAWLAMLIAGIVFTFMPSVAGHVSAAVPKQLLSFINAPGF